jgi:hypothetical protein
VFNWLFDPIVGNGNGMIEIKLNQSPLSLKATAIGLMAVCGYKFQSIIVAALFLVLSVGVDDIFILVKINNL